jgi:AAA ATPase domain
MWINSFRIQNYMSFRDSAEHDLSEHMNIIVGQNNSGKTALLKAIAMRFDNEPHRNPCFASDHVYNPQSIVELKFLASGTEMRNILLASGQQASIPIPDSSKQIPPRALLQQILERDEIRFKTQAFAGGNWAAPYPSHQMFVPGPHDQSFLRTQANSSKSDFTVGLIGGHADNMGQIMSAALRRTTYFFDAQRLNVGRCQVGNRKDLESNASNLAEVLLVLQHNRHKFERLNEHGCSGADGLDSIE